MNELMPELPDEILSARIGTCYDPFTRQLIVNKIAIDPNKLTNGAIMMISGKGELEVTADSSGSKEASGTFLAADSKAKIGSWASLGYHMSLSNNVELGKDSLHCFVSYVYSGQKLRLLDNGPQALFNCMTDEFQHDFNQLLQCEDKTEYFKKYLAFQKKFGNGCVTELALTSGSACEITANFENSKASSESKYGGSVAVGGIWGGLSLAVDYAKTMQQADSKATMSIKLVHYPEDTPTKDWCKGLMDSLSNAAFEKLATKPELLSIGTGNPPTAPEIPAGKSAEEKKLPEKEGSDITEEMRKECMKQDNFEGTWEKYIQAQKEAYEKITPKQVVQSVNQHLESLISCANEEENIDDDDTPERVEMDANGLAWDLGGYVPVSYTYTPWEVLFPQLKQIGSLTTFSSINIGRIYIYYQTRVQFLSYLTFIADVGPGASKNPEIQFDVSAYGKKCTELLKQINTKINRSPVFSKQDCDVIIGKFERDLLASTDFMSRKVYQVFFEHYDFFVNNACGFIFTRFNEDKIWTYPDRNENYKPVPEVFSTKFMLKDACRVYPIIQKTGEMHAVAYCKKNWVRWDVEKQQIWDTRTIDENGFAYYTLSNRTRFPERYYEVGFDELNQVKGTININGLPMMQEVDLDEILNFANPTLEY